ncbi:MAG TPA: hypothetical protein VER03_04165 [Bryobacteraceae bacterium]|nr:hypothetical protein [Bryobacteraceae bacterium]
MKELLVRERMAPWWVGLLVGLVCAFFIWVVFASAAEGGSEAAGLRVFIPVVAIGSYLGLAVVLNVRMVEVTPTGVRIWNGPVPIGASVNTAREEIRVCYARYIVTMHKGSVADRFYTAGVETHAGRQIDIYRRFKNPDKALEAAERVAGVLNYGAVTQIPAGLENQKRDYSHRPKVLAWGALFICAVIMGAIWEIRSEP